MVTILDRAHVRDQLVCEMIVDSIEQVNEITPLSVSDLTLLQRFFSERQHIMKVKTKGIKLVTRLANQALHDSIDGSNQQKPLR